MDGRAAGYCGSEGTRSSQTVVRLRGAGPPEDPWIVEFNLAPSERAAYVNIGTVPQIAHGLVTQVDLDLDVVLLRDGAVVLKDGDEFKANAAGYPDELVELAEQGAARAAARLREATDPFGAKPWLARLAAP